MSVVYENEIVISATDKRHYRHITLPNKLQCLLVSDPETEKSSACCDVAIGSMCDPKEAQGLAHFLEHMLFMGTEKYPVENAYSAYLASHGGFSNAYTSQENTVYYYDVQNDHMEGALDMFASFFTCPLLSDAATTREMNAVDSENTKNLQNDTWRKFQLLKSLARQDHPLNSFSTGNLETLKTTPESAGLNTRDLVVQFYERHYSANLMKVVVYSNQSLDTMQGWVEEKFSAVPNKDLPRPAFPTDPFGPSEVQKYLEVVPIRDVKNLVITFPIPAVEHKYLTKPMSYLGHLLGHESGGSILSALKASHWANGLSAGTYVSNADFACFSITVELTDEGVEHVDEIVACVFAYIGMLQRSGPQEWVWQELKETGDMNFRFLNKSEPSSYATNLANGMHIYAVEHTVCGAYLQFQCDLQEVWSYLSHFKPDNSIILVAHRGFTGKTTLKERWYGTDYNKTDYSAPQLQRWQTAHTFTGGVWEGKLYLPLPNPFLPTDFDLKSGAVAVVVQPVLIERVGDAPVLDDVLVEQERSQEADPVTASGPDPASAEEDSEPAAEGQNAAQDEGDEEGEGVDEGEDGLGDAAAELPVLAGDKLLTWHLQDTTWKMPKANVKVSLETLQAASSPLSVTLTELLAMCLKENLNEYSYYADCAGLCYDVTLAKGGLDIAVQGYGHKLPVLLGKIIEEMQRFASDPTACSADLFARMKQKSLRNLKNYLFWQPYYHCMIGSLLCLEDGRFGSAEKHRALEGATHADFFAFTSTFVKSLKAQVLVHGNVTALDAKKLTAEITTRMPFRALPLSQTPVRRVVQLPAGSHYIYRQHAVQTNPHELNSAVENVYLVGLSEGSAAGGMQPQPTSQGVVSEASLELLAHMMSEPAFDQLRTKEQLGYIVFTGLKRLNQQYLALHMIVQSSHKDADYLDGRVESFLLQYREDLRTMSEEAFAQFVAAVIEKLVEKPKNIDEECDRYWNEITNGMYWFNRKATLASVLRAGAVTRESLLQFFDAFLGASSPQRRKFSAQFYGKGKRYVKPADTSAVVVEEPVQFRRSLPLYPVPKFSPA